MSTSRLLIVSHQTFAILLHSFILFYSNFFSSIFNLGIKVVLWFWFSSFHFNLLWNLYSPCYYYFIVCLFIYASSTSRNIQCLVLELWIWIPWIRQKKEKKIHNNNYSFVPWIYFDDFNINRDHKMNNHHIHESYNHVRYTHNKKEKNIVIIVWEILSLGLMFVDFRFMTNFCERCDEQFEYILGICRLELNLISYSFSKKEFKTEDLPTLNFEKKFYY